MNSLRFVSLSEDGTHLIVSNDAGERFAVAVTDELRGAMSRRRAPRTPSAPVPLSPRDIQARIRHGATSEEVAAETGLPIERIESYAAPVRAERDHAAGLARGTEVADRTLTRDAVRAVFGEQPVTLEDMVVHRASLSGISADSLEWDAWKRADGQWDICLEFSVEDASVLEGTELGSVEPEARWVYNPLRKTMHNVNRWAQFLSELEPLESAPSGRRLKAVEPADEDMAASGPAQEETPEEPDSSELLDMLNQRRGTRLGADTDSDDRLALMISDSQRAAAARRDESQPGRSEQHDARTGSHAGGTGRGESAPEGAESPEDEMASRRKPKKSLRDRRSRVPSWDQIYFGTKPDSER